MMRRILILLITVMMVTSVFNGCKKTETGELVNECVLQAWNGNFAKEERQSAIEKYAQKYIPVYAVNIEAGRVRVELGFDGVECGQVALAPVDDSKKDWELNTVVDFSTEIDLAGSSATIAIDWWYSAPAAAQQYKVWSYLFWVKDAEGVQHYYYFRVDYTS